MHSALHRRASRPDRRHVLVQRCVLAGLLATGTLVAPTPHLFGQATPLADASAYTAGSIVGSLVQTPQGRPAANAQVRVVGLQKLATTDSQGAFTLEGLAPGTYSLAITGPGLQAMRITELVVRPGQVSELAAIEVPAVPNDAGAQELEEIIIRATQLNAQHVMQMESFAVTGSNLRMNASEADRGRLPVELIPQEKLNFTSGERVGDFLRGQPFIAGAYLSSGGTGAGGWTSMSIHGIGRNYTLSLLNGRRFIQEDTVADISGVPPEALESLEVLKGGASAIYGPSAVGGVINMKLKENYEGAELTLSYGNTTDEDSASRRAALLFGTKAGKLSLTGGVSWSDRNSVEAQDREILSDPDYRRWGGLDRRTSTFGDPMRIVRASATSSPLILNTANFSPGQTGTAASDFVAYSAATDSMSTTIPYASAVSAETRTQAFWNGNYEILGKRLVFYAYGFYDRHDTHEQTAAQYVTVSVPASNPYNPFGETVTAFYHFNHGEISPDNAVRSDWFTDANQGLFGLRGEIGDFTYDFGINNAQLDRTQTVIGDIATELAQAAANRTDATALNVFGYNANTAAQVAGIAPTHSYVYRNKMNIIDAKVTGPIYELPAGDARFAVGAERRDSSSQRIYDDLWRTYTFSATSRQSTTPLYTRTVDAYFGEIDIPVYRAKDGGRLVNAVEINGSMRREEYSDFGNASIGGFGGRVVALDDTLVLRAVYSEGFRAPFVSELTAPQNSSTVTGLYDPVRGGTFPVTRITGGNPSLKPEVADTYDFGFIYSPPVIPNLTLRADYWSVDLKDRIFAPNAQSILNGTVGADLITRDPVTGAVTIDGRNTNGNQRTAEGIDFGGTYTLNTGGLGRFIFDLSSTYTTKFEDVSGAQSEQLLDNYRGSLNLTGGTGVEPVPRLRSVLSTFWNYRTGWSAGFTVHYSKGLHDVTGAIDRRSEDYWTGDVQLRYDFGDTPPTLPRLFGGMRISVGVDNVWDEALPFVATTTNGWDQNISDIRGRYYYLRVSKKL